VIFANDMLLAENI